MAKGKENYWLEQDRKQVEQTPYNTKKYLRKRGPRQ